MLRVEHRNYMIGSMFSMSEMPEGYQPAVTGSTVELGEWDETRAMSLTSWKMNPAIQYTSFLPAPQSATRVEFRWVLIQDCAETTTEVDCKYLDLEPDLGGLPRELACFLICPTFRRSGTWTMRMVATTDGNIIDPSAKLQTTGPCKPGGSRIVMFGGTTCAGFGAHTPWYNQTCMSAGWAHELAAVLH